MNPILHVINGTPGTGKSTSRFPFITLLMSFGVESVTTAKIEERTYIFKLKDPVETGTTTIYLDDRYDPFPGFETTSYVYTYNVYSYKERKRAHVYKPNDPIIPRDLSSSTEWEHLGHVSVPSVEHFPYFVRLLVAPKTEPLDGPELLLKDNRILQKSTLASGSTLAPGSVLIDDSYFQNEYLTEDFSVPEQMILLEGSIVAKDSSILEYPASTVSLFHDDDGTELRMNTQPDPTPIDHEKPLDRDYVLEIGSILKEGSRVTLKLPRPRKKPRLRAEMPITHPIEIAAGSIIAANSVLAAGSSIYNNLEIKNFLKGQRWHVVDDLMFSKTSNLQVDENYVLFTSPKNLRWKEVNNNIKRNPVYIVEYSVPKFTPQEQAALLNTMGIQPHIFPTNIPDIKKSVELFSFIPRFVLKPKLAQPAVDSVWKSDKCFTRISPKDLFNDDISENLIQFSCPQYDCHNWHTEFASELAKTIILNTFNTAMQKEHARSVLSLTNDRELNQQKEAVFHAFVSDAILGGLRITSPRRLVAGETLPANIKLPAPIGESYVCLRNSESMRKASLPDIKHIPLEKLRDFEQQWTILFSSPMHPCFISSTKLGGEGDIVAVTRPITHHEDITQSRQQNLNDSNAKCFTFYLKPLGGTNEEFGSILLFFKVHAEQEDLKVDDISVMFIYSTLAQNSFFSRTMSNLMFLWLALLSTVYGLSQQHIHPFVFFVKLPTFNDFTLEGPNTTDSFIPTDNVWVIDAYAREDPEDHHALTEQLLLSSVATLQPNTNPYHFRCYFCDCILTEFFPSHRCQNIQKKHSQASDIRTEDAMWKWGNSVSGRNPAQTAQPQAEDGSVPQFVFNLVSTHPAYRDTGCEEQQRAVVGIRLAYPQPDFVPNSCKDLQVFDVMNVEMVRVGEQTVPHLPIHPTPHEQEQRVSWKITHSDPIPNIFTYFPRRPKARRPPQPTISRMPDVAFRGTETRRIVLNEFENRTSHLRTSVNLVDVWINKKRIGFGEDRRNDVLSIGALPSAHMRPTCLWKRKNVPLAQIHLPMTIFPKQTVLLGTRQLLTPFEIRGILSLVGKKSPNDLNSTLSSESLIQSCINEGQSLAPNVAELIISEKRVFSLLPTSNLHELRNRLPRLKSLPMYELQSLVSFVSGTPTLISDILEMIEDSLPPPEQPTDQDLENETQTVNHPTPKNESLKSIALSNGTLETQCDEDMS